MLVLQHERFGHLQLEPLRRHTAGVGANDLCMEMGIPGQLDHPRIAEAFERIVAACRANGKYAGLGGVYNPPLMERYLAMGFRLVLAGTDLSFMLGAARERAAAVRAMPLA
jgi:2-keto-3-deoxy-L-rhamnonate aldolase RhmA